MMKIDNRVIIVIMIMHDIVHTLMHYWCTSGLTCPSLPDELCWTFTSACFSIVASKFLAYSSKFSCCSPVRPSVVDVVSVVTMAACSKRNWASSHFSSGCWFSGTTAESLISLVVFHSGHFNNKLCTILIGLVVYMASVLCAEAFFFRGKHTLSFYMSLLHDEFIWLLVYTSQLRGFALGLRNTYILPLCAWQRYIFSFFKR